MGDGFQLFILKFWDVPFSNFCYISTSLGFKFGKSTPTLNPVPPFQIVELKIPPESLQWTVLGFNSH